MPRNQEEGERCAMDLISREVAIDDIKSRDPSRIWDIVDIEEWVSALPSAQPEPSQVARDIATIIENEQDMMVIERNAQRWIPCSECERRCDKWEDSKI